MPFTRYSSFKTITILREMAETICEAGATGKESVLDIKLYNTLNRKKSILANRDRHYIYQDGKGNRAVADLRYGEEDSIYPSTLIFLATKG